MMMSLVLVLISCKEAENHEIFSLPANQPQSVQFTFSPNSNADSRSTLIEGGTHLRINIQTTDGEPVLTDEEIMINPFGNSYISEWIILPVADYYMTSFLVLNEQEQVIYASPISGSLLSALVSEPLPMSFTVASDRNSVIVPKVLLTSRSDNPEDYGYGDFGYIAETASHLGSSHE